MACINPMNNSGVVRFVVFEITHLSIHPICDGIFESDNSGGCFSGSSTVETEERGNIPIGNLRLGDNVLTSTHGKGVHYTEVIHNR